MVFAMMIRRYDVGNGSALLFFFFFFFCFSYTIHLTRFSLTYLLCIDSRMEDTFVHYSHGTLL